MSALSTMKAIPAAMIFLTRLPVPGKYSAEDFVHASAFFPLVGLGIGAVGALVHRLMLGLGPALAACLSVAAVVALTGALHEDGLADTADALLGGATKERALEIAKDPRLGSFGAIALFLVLATRLAFFGSRPDLAALAFVLGAVLSRASATVMMASLPYVSAPETSRSSSVVSTNGAHAMVAVLTALGTLGYAYAFGHADVAKLVAALVAAIAVSSLLARWFMRRVGGLLGDFLGATIVLVDLAVSFALLLEMR